MRKLIAVAIATMGLLLPSIVVADINQPKTEEFMGLKVATNLQYGPLKGKTSLDFYPGTAVGEDLNPIIILAPDYKKNKRTALRDENVHAFVERAINKGYSVASLNFRTGPTVKRGLYDFASAIQYLRNNAKVLNIDSASVFIVGEGRATHGLWTALQDDLANRHGYQQEQRSTKVSAVWLIEPDVGRTFRQRTKRAANFTSNLDHCINSVTSDDPALHVVDWRWPISPFADWAHKNRYIHGDHFINLTKAYHQAGIQDKLSIEWGVNPNRLFDGALDYFDQHLTATN